MATYYAAPFDTFFAIPFVLMVWYAIDREVVRYYKQRREARENLARQAKRR